MDVCVFLVKSSVVCLGPVEAQQVEAWSNDAEGDEFALSKHHCNLSARPWRSTYIYHAVASRVPILPCDGNCDRDVTTEESATRGAGDLILS